MKKLFIFALLLVTSFALAACGDDGVDEDQQDVNAVRDTLVLSGLDSIRSDKWVPAEGRFDTTITWETDEPDFIAPTDETRVNDAGMEEVKLEVNRPGPDEDHVDVVLTATITKGDAEAERSFEGSVRAEDPIDHYDSIDELYDNATVNDLVSVTGVVFARVGSGYFITDGEYALSIFRGGTFDLGDEITVTGHYAGWNTLRQLSDIENEELHDTGQDYDMDAEEMTIEDMNDDAFLEEPRSHGMRYEVTGYLNYTDSYTGYDDFILESMESDDYLIFTHYAMDEQDEYLEDYEGELITITVHLYARHTDGVLVFIDPDTVETEIGELGEEDLFDQDVDELEGTNFMTYQDDIDLPEEGENGTTFTNWASGNTDILDDDGTFVATPEDSQYVTFTADAEYVGDYDTFTGTVEIKVAVAGETMSIADAMDYDDGELVHIEAVVTGFDAYFDPSNIFIQDDDGTGLNIRLFDRDVEPFEDVEVGNKITVFGELDRYTSWGNNDRQLSGHKLLTSNDGEDHDLYIEEGYTIEDIITGFNLYDEDGDDNQPGGITNSRIYTLEDIVIDNLDEHGYVFVDGSYDMGMDDPSQLTFALDTVEELDEDEFEGPVDIASITFITQRVHFGNYRIIVTDIELAD